MTLAVWLNNLYPTTSPLSPPTAQADPGTHADVPPGPRRIISFFLTAGGMVIFALLIGIVSDEISAKVDDLRKGAWLPKH